MSRRWVVAAAAAAGVIALTVLAIALPATLQPAPFPAGPTEEQKLAWIQSNLDSRWESLDLPDELRPVIEPERRVGWEDYNVSYVECMTAENVEGVTVAADNNITFSSDTAVDIAAFMFADYICLARYPIDPELSGLMSAAQREYLYDYYERWLVPCLSDVAGERLRDVPSRAEFRNEEQFLYWSPYNQFWNQTWDPRTQERIEELQVICPMYPRGVMGR